MFFPIGLLALLFRKTEVLTVTVEERDDRLFASLVGEGNDSIVDFLYGELVHSAQKQCPNCHKPMNRDASVCPNCQNESQPWTFHQGLWWAESPSAAESGLVRWQWFDERGGFWRWYDEGTAAHPAVTDETPSRALDPAVVKPPGSPATGLEAATEQAGEAQISTSAELERLADLHARGVLSDDEFAKAKARVLDSSPP